jgi:hypothetical protein
MLFDSRTEGKILPQTNRQFPVIELEIGGTMNSKKAQSLPRAILQGWIALGLIVAAAVNVTSALAATPPANDNFANAKKITTTTFGASLSDMTGATTEVGDPALTCDGGGQGQASIWYTYSPLLSGEMSLNTTNSGYDTIITVFMAEVPSDISTLVEVGCNDDANFSTTTSSMTFAVRGGVKYYIQIARKTGAATTPPDPFRFAFSFTTKPILLPGALYDGTDDEIIYSPVGWTLVPILPGTVYKGNIHIGNNPGDSATVFFDGSGVQFCYVLGPEMGNMNVYIDGVFIGTIGQGSGLYQYTCWDTPPLPIIGSASLVEDNVHKLVLQHGGPAGKKVNLDSFWVYYHPDIIDPGVISDLAATTGAGTGKVTLTWTATGDDGYIGRVYGNQIRYSLNPIVDAASWDAATPYVINLPNLLPAGSKQTVTLTGLVPGLTYFFNVRGVDEVGNMGPVSNSPSAIAQAGTPIGIGTYDDKSAYWTYTGTWSVVGSPGNVGGAIHLANQLGSTASFYFTGTQFRLYYNSGFGMGLLDVILDGAYLTTIDQYSVATQRMIYVSPMLTNGPHSVQFIQKSLPYVNIDAIAIFNIIDGGPPDAIVDLVATPNGVTPGAVDLTWTAQGDDPGGVGTAMKYEIRYSMLPILTESDWNAATTVPGVIPAPQPAGTPEGMTVTGLTPGVDYWFVIRASDNAGYSNLSNSDNAIGSIVGLAYWGAGFYEDNDPAWLYNGIWMIGSFPQASGGGMHTSGASGSTATFLFNGTGFTVTFQTKSGLGTLKVYVDGIQVGAINQRTTLTYWQRTWSRLGLAAGNHTVQFVAAGTVTIDALEIFP